VAIVHARTKDSVLLMRRADRAEDPWSGHWSFPGGRREAEDCDLLQTALRELEEECGIRLHREELESALVPATARQRSGPFLQVAPYVLRIDDEKTVTLDLREAVEARWIPLEVLRDPARHALFPAPGLSPDVRFPAIDLNGVPLWGFTYRLITEWLNLNPGNGSLQAAGFQVARALLDAIVADGCRLNHDFLDRAGVKVASVNGTIPVDLFWRIFLSPHTHVPRLNMLEVRSDQIRLVGLALEE